MIGLPFERQEDLDGIVDLAVHTSELRREVNKKPAQVNISINTLVPRPHTPFQWFKMQHPEDIERKCDYLKSKIKNKCLRFSSHSPYMTLLEAVLSRGDRRLSKVILSAFNRGAGFDAWENYFRFPIWQEAFYESKIDPHLYLQERTRDEFLPWDFLDVGISKEMLLKEADKISEDISYGDGYCIG
jgi:hypothetical protein